MASSLFEHDESLDLQGQACLLDDLACMNNLDFTISSEGGGDSSNAALLFAADTDADTETASAEQGIWPGGLDDRDPSAETDLDTSTGFVLHSGRSEPSAVKGFGIGADGFGLEPLIDPRNDVGLSAVSLGGVSGSACLGGSLDSADGYLALPSRNAMPAIPVPHSQVVGTASARVCPSHSDACVVSPSEVDFAHKSHEYRGVHGRQTSFSSGSPSKKARSTSAAYQGKEFEVDTNAASLALDVRVDRAEAGALYGTPRSPSRSRGSRGGFDGLEGLDEQKRAELASKSHTSRCRAKVNAKLAAVMAILPPPPPNVPVKHKAQALRYVCSMIEATMARQSELEAELMLSHPAKLGTWLRSNVASCKTLDSALDPVLRLLMARTGWKCADAWKIDAASHVPALRCSVSVIQPGKAHSDPLHRFVRASAPVRFSPAVGVPGRVFASRQPEWTTIAPPPTFLRESVARDVGLNTCFALPLEVHGKVVAVVAVYDTRERQYESQVFDISHDIIGAVNSTLTELIASSEFDLTR